MKPLTEEHKQLLLNFMKHRRLNDRAIAKLQEIKEQEDLKATQIQTSKTLPYDRILENLLKSVEQDWLSEDDFIEMLDESEFSGRQHVCIFNLPEKGRNKILEVLRSPQGGVGSLPDIRDFVSVPKHSTARVVIDTKEVVAVKIVTRRAYWITNILEQNVQRELFERLNHQERAAVIVKCNASSGLIQFRLPPREKGLQETAKAVYDFLATALGEHYPVNQQSWFSQLQSFPIADAYANILANHDDFELWHDTPEDDETKTKVSKKGRPSKGADLRKASSWKYDKGYSRTNIRGFWSCPSGQDLFVHMNADVVNVGNATKRHVARLVINELCSDEDIDHVAERIRQHI